MPKFTKSYIEGLKPKEKPYEVWDTEVKGLGCKVYSTGRKVYYFLYRSSNSNTKQRLKVGVHASITCDIARDIARGWAGDIARRINPKEHIEKQEAKEKQSITMDCFLKIYVEKYKNVYNKQTTIDRDAYRIKGVILPFFGNLKISDISHDDLIRFQAHMKNSPIQFNRCNAILSKAFSLAELWGYRYKNTNPCHGIQKYPEKKKERFLTQIEIETLDDILNLPEVVKLTSPYSIAAIRMLMYTGCRSGEILSLKWSDVFLTEGYLHLKDSKTGEKTIPINESAKSILINLRQQKGNPYVFVGEKPGACLTTLKTAWTKVRRLAKLEEVRIHDLRHTFASLAIKQGVDLYTVSKLLGHKNIATTTRYAHLEIKQLIKATNVVDQIWQVKR